MISEKHFWQGSISCCASGAEEDVMSVSCLSITPFLEAFPCGKDWSVSLQTHFGRIMVFGTRKWTRSPSNITNRSSHGIICADHLRSFHIFNAHPSKRTCCWIAESLIDDFGFNRNNGPFGAEQSCDTKSPNWRANDALEHVEQRTFKFCGFV